MGETFQYSTPRMVAWAVVLAVLVISTLGAAIGGSPGSLILLPVLLASAAYLLRRLRTPTIAVVLTDDGLVDHRFGETTIRWDEVSDVRLDWWGVAPWPKVVTIDLLVEVPCPTALDLALGRPVQRTASHLRLYGTIVRPGAPAQADAIRRLWRG